jgi:hypothetical protein
MDIDIDNNVLLPEEYQNTHVISLFFCFCHLGIYIFLYKIEWKNKVNILQSYVRLALRMKKLLVCTNLFSMKHTRKMRNIILEEGVVQFKLLNSKLIWSFLESYLIKVV